MLSEILLLAESGDVIARNRYKHDIKCDPVLEFYQLISNCQKVLPHFEAAGVHYFLVLRDGIYIVGVSSRNDSALSVIQLLNRVHQLLKDFCGVVTQQSLLANRILVYEILDEILDYGLVQTTGTDKLKPYLQSQPVITHSSEDRIPGLLGVEHQVARGDASSKPVIASKLDHHKDEVFLDVIERLNVLVSRDGTISRCDIQGQVNMKTFLRGDPRIRLGLNEDLTIGSTSEKTGYGGSTHLDSLTLHPCVKTDGLDRSRVLEVHPPQGEFTLLDYTVTKELPLGLPFRVYTYQETTTRDVAVGVKLRCEIPSYCQAVKLCVYLSVPASTNSISQQLTGPEQTATFSPKDKKVCWKLDKISGKSEASAHFTLIGARSGDHPTSDIGPVAITFEISGFVCSGLSLRFLGVSDREKLPARWIRYITVADSYICKLV